MSDTETAAWAALLRVHAAVVPILDRALQSACGLPLTWYDVLLELRHAPAGRLSMGELGERAVVSRTRVSRVVDQLAAAGLVVRESNPDDRRSAHAAITEAGRARLREAAPVYLDGIRRHFTGLMSPEEAIVVAGALEKVLRGPGHPAAAGPLRKALDRQGETAVILPGAEKPAG
ncbi:MarR family winged helix-turn-helix transcriptional regulator [Actinoplanes sp. L3-i22]|uniref:MarR family winged helix-turn-helix transcriptional regulator n=1 Tax=Actinoplanes sp. L3-i22 TaxID=2836373 RepID=UPI001C757ECF|nr:MarR family transcriptional regulator [Actinoplanes sp. L3-i22]BCY07787.1 MarR family transcriptional regulator [Actinoplanes sp. L3-i22]